MSSAADSKDWTAREFASILKRCGKDSQPITDALEGRNPVTGYDEPSSVWYSSQKEHVTDWLSEMAGPGAYNRKGSGYGARHFWQYFQCPDGLIWVAEALGEDPAIVQAAAHAFCEMDGQGKRLATQCAAIRKIIPWERIAELAELREDKIISANLRSNRTVRDARKKGHAATVRARVRGVA